MLVVVLVTSLAAMAATSLAYADGIDVSHWQGSIDWSKVKAAGMQFAFMKATESTTYTDTALTANWAGAGSVGLYRGAYHFARPSKRRLRGQRRRSTSSPGSARSRTPGRCPRSSTSRPRGGLGVTALRTWTQTWLTRVEQLTGRVPIIYFSPAVLGALTSATAPPSPATRCGSRTTA